VYRIAVVPGWDVLIAYDRNGRQLARAELHSLFLPAVDAMLRRAVRLADPAHTGELRDGTPTPTPVLPVPPAGVYAIAVPGDMATFVAVDTKGQTVRVACVPEVVRHLRRGLALLLGVVDFMGAPYRPAPAATAGGDATAPVPGSKPNRGNS
jgi:hypothetical protein